MSAPANEAQTDAIPVAESKGTREYRGSSDDSPC